MNVAMNRLMDDAVLEAVDHLRPIADQAGAVEAELALAWVLRCLGVASAIVGASRPEQVHANAKASGIQLTPDTLVAIEEALGDTPVKEPTLAPLARPGVTHREAGYAIGEPAPVLVRCQLEPGDCRRSSRRRDGLDGVVRVDMASNPSSCSRVRVTARKAAWSLRSARSGDRLMVGRIKRAAHPGRL
jgi:hypothetical protein